MATRYVHCVQERIQRAAIVSEVAGTLGFAVHMAHGSHKAAHAQGSIDYTGGGKAFSVGKDANRMKVRWVVVGVALTGPLLCLSDDTRPC